jgi:protein-S-isoprenylcysteine O-methyltransferase Ste14
MTQSGQTQGKVSTGFIVTAVVLLLGIVVLAVGHFSCNRPAFYAGLLITVAGALVGIQQFIAHGGSWRSKR